MESGLLDPTRVGRVTPDTTFNVIKHYDIHSHLELTTENWLHDGAGGSPIKSGIKIILTSGASCPDAILDEVLQKIVSYFHGAKSVEEALKPFETEVGV